MPGIEYLDNFTAYYIDIILMKQTIGHNNLPLHNAPDA